MPLRYQSFWLFFYALIALLTTSCTSVRLSDYADQKPHFDMQEYFNGRVVAYGIVQDRSGKVIRRMTVDMQCSWQGDTGTLD